VIILNLLSPPEHVGFFEYPERHVIMTEGIR
jgi:hypothetical protein